MDTTAPQNFSTTLAALGLRARRLRLISNLTQAELARRAGVGLATVQRFEKTGHGSLDSTLRIAIALRAEADFDRLFSPPRYASLDEALARPAIFERKRARGQR